MSGSPKPNRPEALVLADLLNGLVHGKFYQKSKHIAARTNLSPKQVGNILAELSKSDGPIVVEQEANGSGENWTVDVDLDER